MSKAEILQIADLPDCAVDAAVAFYDRYLDRIRMLLDGETELLVIAVPTAAYDHDDWRRAAARDLARQYTPQRVLVVAGGDKAAFAATVSYLGTACGVTGQLLKLNV